MARALDTLPFEQRHALVLHHVLEMSVPEVAEEMRAPIETVRSRLRLGRVRLRELLSPSTERKVS
jgi:RNA polymerase sigma-70 factor (ECF subfamily)